MDAVAAGAVPHHCFHVFAVYPWLGLLRAGVVDEPLRVLDQCRTTPARVVSRRRRRRRSSSRAAALGERRLALGASTLRRGALARRRARVVATARGRATRLAPLGLRVRRPDAERGG